LIADNHATKLAYRMARALLRPRDELQLVTVVANEEGELFGKRLLEQYEQEPCENVVTPVVSHHLLVPEPASPAWLSVHHCAEQLPASSSDHMDAPVDKAPAAVAAATSGIPACIKHSLLQVRSCAFLQVLVKGDLRLDEAISQHMAAASADLLVMGSHNLCAAGGQTAWAALAALAAAGASSSGLQYRHTVVAAVKAVSAAVNLCTPYQIAVTLNSSSR
jgi:nucleotide-binding universal stress UspA family protein